MQTNPADADTQGDALKPIGTSSTMRMNELQQQIGRGEYEVDTLAVADAVLRHMLAHGRLRAPGDDEPDGDSY